MDYRIEQLRYLLREDPSSRIFYQLGELLRREGEPAQAVEVLRTGLERHPRYVAAWVSLGRSQRDLHALEAAAAAFRTALEIDRENPVAARLLGETAVEREDWLGAVKAFKLARALTGANDGLDAQIAMVEDRLDEDGRLEQRPFGQPRPPAEPPARPPVRCLEVVHLSSDDPFSASPEEPAARLAMDDVFAGPEAAAASVAEAVVEEDEAPFEVAAADETAEPMAGGGVDVFDAAAPDQPRGIDAAATEAVVAVEPDGIGSGEDETVAAAPEPVGEPDAVPLGEASIVDESSVGAWSTTMRAAGVPGDEAWTEPGDRIVSDDGASSDESWAEPGAATAAVEAPSGEVLDVVETAAAAEPAAVLGTAAAEEPPRLEEPAEIAGDMDDRGDDEVVEPGVGGEDFDTPEEPVPAVDIHQFDSIEVTHPLVVERRSAVVEAPPPADVDERSAADEARDGFEAAFDGAVPPGEDRGFDAVEVTRPIPLPGRPDAGEPEPAPTSAAPLPPSAEVVDDGPTGDDAPVADHRHTLDHGVPLPTMTLARLALAQDDRPLAMATLESLLERDPANGEAAAMLDELRAREATAANEKLRAVRATGKIATLQGWLDAVRLAAERRVQ